MKNYETNHTAMLGALLKESEEEVLAYVHQELCKCFGDDAPDADTVRSYLLYPEKGVSLTAQEQLVAMDKLLEYAEINIRTTCYLMRYKMCRKAGIVNSVDEFLELLRSEEGE